MKLYLLILLAAFQSIYPVGYVAEIVNNTDHDIYIKSIDLNGYAKPSILSSISLVDGSNIFLPSLDLPQGNKIQKRTHCIISGLTIHMVKAGVPSPFGLHEGAYAGSGFTLCFRLQIGANRPPAPLVFLRQTGDLLEIAINSPGLRHLEFLGEIMGPTRFVSNDKVTDGKLYRIEINQVSKNPIRNWPSDKDSLDVIIKHSSLTPQDLIVPEIKQPLAYIDNFVNSAANRGNVSVGVRFNGLGTKEFFENFNNFITRSSEIKRTCQSSVNNDSGSIAFHFYTDMTQERFQSMIDEANKVKIPCNYLCVMQ